MRAIYRFDDRLVLLLLIEPAEPVVVGHAWLPPMFFVSSERKPARYMV